MKKTSPGVSSIFVFRSNLGMQNSLQSTTEREGFDKPLLIPRLGTAASIGAPTVGMKPLPQEK